MVIFLDYYETNTERKKKNEQSIAEEKGKKNTNFNYVPKCPVKFLLDNILENTIFEKRQLLSNIFLQFNASFNLLNIC